jgi:hypothetical protein
MSRPKNSKNKIQPILKDVVYETITPERFKTVINKLYFIAMNDESKSQIKAIEILFAYVLGKPRQEKEVTVSFEPQNDFNFNDFIQFVRTDETAN